MAELKILVCGDVEGNFKALFTKIDNILKKKGTFENLLCVGNFFGSNNDEWKDLLNGKIKVPLTTYILGPNKAEHVKYFEEISKDRIPNLILLGKRGVLTGCSGLKIAYLPGIEHRESTPYFFNKKDISDLLTLTSQYGVDILLTSQWPAYVAKYAKAPDQSDISDSKLIAHLAKEMKPRYHFAGLSKLYYERLPYRNHKVLQEAPSHVTRFIGLAPVNNNKNIKWLYAFTIVPYCSMNLKELAKISGPTTECPYDEIKEDQMNEFFYDSGSSSHKKRSSDNSEQNKHKRNKFTVSQDTCWFCLGNPTVEKHLLISVGEFSYIALPKGGLVEDHLLILPIEHIDVSICLSKNAFEEIQKFKKALASYFYKKEKDIVFFERNLSSAHLQIQAVPVPCDVTSKVKDTVFELGLAHGVEFNELPEFALIKQIIPEKTSYFYFEIVQNKVVVSKLLCNINKHIPIQFGRMVLANEAILNLPDHIDWKDCKLSQEEERKLAIKFRDNFKPYDFTL